MSADVLFQKTLQDLVKGIRSNKKDPSSYISQAIAEIKTELKSNDPFLKSEAVRKLTYLQMLGYNMSWAAFSVVEVMSQTRFAHKRIGYLAANQSFTESTDVILLTTNLFKKELSTNANSTQYEVGLALNCLANIVTKDLARDCISDVVGLINHTRPYVRKKAILTLYKMFVKFPMGLRLTFERIKERLDDSESSVVSCAVNVICELANKNPKNYLAMAPKFFRLLTTSSNNWMLIKVVKLMGSLVSEEPRLARKLLDPLATIIQNTGAKSLQYECIQTITESLLHTKREDGTDAKNVPDVVKLCSNYLRGFIEESDQNLKYLGLVGLVSLLKSHPRHVVEHRELILKCLNDDDNTIRVRALELLAGIVSKKSLVDLVHHLLEHAKRAEGNYRDEIISKVIYMCSKDKFGLVTDFAWYISVLLDLAVMQGSKHGKDVADQLIDVSLRVDTVRPLAVESMLSLLLNEKLILGVARRTVSEVLKAAAWIVGEYSHILTFIANDDADDEVVDSDENAGYWIEGPNGEDIRSMWRGQDLHKQVINALLSPRATNLPPHVQCAYIQAAMKVFIRACVDREEEEIASMIGTLRSKLTIYLQSQNIEVQERASTLRYILSDFGILPLDWETTAKRAVQGDNDKSETELPSKEIIIEQSKKSTSFLMDLLDPTAEIQNSVVATKPIDDGGARQAKLKANVLLAAIAEPFYAVHSKAQKKVPVPEGLNLEAPIKESALHKLLNVEIPQNVALTNLYFVPPAIIPGSFHGSDSTYGSSSVYATTDEERSMLATAADVLKGTFSSTTIGSGSSTDSSKPNPTSLSHTNIAPPPRNPDDNLFYLSSASTNREVVQPSLSQILADTFEEKKSSKKGKKDKEKGHKSTKVDIDKREMLPAGAVSSDDETKRKKSSRKSSNSNDIPITRRKGKDDIDLSNVDITTPLREDEVLTQPKHREVPVKIIPAVVSLSSVTTTEETKKSKKSKDDDDNADDADTQEKKSDKKKKKSKSSSKETKSKPSSKDKKGADDLLSFDWIPASEPASSAINSSLDFLAINSSDVQSTLTATKSGKTKETTSKSSSKKSSSNVWLTLTINSRVEIFYSVNKSSSLNNALSVSFRAMVLPEASSGYTVDIVIPSVLPHFQFSNGSTSTIVSVGRSIRHGDEATASIDMIYDPSTFTTTSVIGATARIAPDILSPGEQLVNMNTSFKAFYHISLLTPHSIDDGTFASLIGKSSSRWGNASTKINFNGKAKTAMKAVALFLRAHIVEEEYTRAVSLCSKTTTGGNVYGLVKWAKDTTTLSIDIKTLLSSKSESNALAESIVTALQELRL